MYRCLYNLEHGRIPYDILPRMPRTTTRYIVRLIGLLMLVSIVNVADKELLAPVAEVVRRDLNLSDTQLGMVRSAVFLAALLGQLFWGPLSDVWVRKYVITTGTLIWSGVTWLTAFVGGFSQLVMARASMSFAEGCFNPSAYALLTDTVPRQKHGLILGLMSLTYPVGTATALVVASVIGTEHWRKPFLLFGVIGLLLGLLVLGWVREPARGSTEEAVAEGAGEYTGRFTFKQFGSILTVPTVWLAFALDTCQASVNWSFAFWAPLYLTRYHIAPDADTAAIALLPAILGFVIGALLGGWIIDRLRPRTQQAAVWVALLAMSGGLVMSLLVFNLFKLPGLMTAAFFLGVVAYMVMPAINIILFSVVPPETKATAISSSNVILNLVIALLSLLVGVVSDATELRLALGGTIVIMFALGALVSLLLLRTFGRDASRREAAVTARIINA